MKRGLIPRAGNDNIHERLAILGDVFPPCGERQQHGDYDDMDPAIYPLRGER